MEVCGGQTHAIVRFGIDQLLPPEIELLHGPGCPVCVTPVELIDKALAIAARPGVIFCSFGDMLRVPGSGGDLFGARAGGADVRVVYSPLDAVRLAAENPGRQVVFFAIGFETTAPSTALTLKRARAEVARLQRQFRFDLLHHVTWASCRSVPAVWGHGVPMVWGPVAGLDALPWHLLPWLWPRELPETDGR